jgi:hypothetical protein
MRIIDDHAIEIGRELTSVTFGTVIQLLSRPDYWHDYQKWNPTKLYLLTQEYYQGAVGDGFDENPIHKRLMVVELYHGQCYPLDPRTKVLERNDLVLTRPEIS